MSTPTKAAMAAAASIHYEYSDEWWEECAKKQDKWKPVYEGARRKRRALAQLIDRETHLREVVEFLGGCGNHGCAIKRPVGMATNGPCRCRERAVELLSKLEGGR